LKETPKSDHAICSVIKKADENGPLLCSIAVVIVVSINIHKHYATNRKVVGSRSEEMNNLFLIYQNIPTAPGAGVYSACNKNEYQKQ
jgi:hypothetical protein